LSRSGRPAGYSHNEMRVLLTNDDGIAADGLQALRRALLALPGIELQVVAPDGNRSAMARSITTRRPLWVEEIDFGDGTVGYATDGTPVDCVRLASLGLVDDWAPEIVVSGINHGVNVGDDITYSGTVAAALEGIVLGLPAVAVSQQSTDMELDYRRTSQFDFTGSAAFTARLVQDLDAVPLPSSTLLNINFPGREPVGISVAPLGKRYYRDELQLVDQEHAQRRLYRIYGEGVEESNETDTDVAAVAAGRVALTPLHLDLTHHDGVASLQRIDLERLLHEQ
jgi:5'-nucleotidase